MPAFNRTLWRLAGKFANRLAMRPQPVVRLDLDAVRFADLQSLGRRTETVVGRGWPAALQHCVRELRSQLVRFRRHLDSVGDRLDQPLAESLPTQRLIYDELLALTDEFADVNFDLRQETLKVVTDPITLEDVELGRFRIVLRGPDLLAGLFQVIAVTPNPAVSRPYVTHPHVSENRLCEGDATAPLDKALATGRLGDFFQIVQQTLQTYNSSSPYVSLSEWTGTRCRICNDSASDDESCCCDRCEQDVCDSCSSYCSRCSQTACDDCLESCQQCEERSCAGCLATCPDCRLKYCQNCLINQLCEDCHAARHEETNNEQTTEPDSRPPVLTDGLCEAAVPA